MNKWIFIFFCLWAKSFKAQNTDSLFKESAPIVLDEVVLSDDKLVRWSIGASILNLDSVLLNKTTSNLASLLSTSSHIRIRSYGSLATSSIRGAGAAHTQVLWNGISLNSPMTGQYDLSLVPLFFVNSLRIQSGGMNTLYGDAAIGGSIHLNSKLKFNQGNHLEFTNTVGSFGELNLGVKTTVSKAKSAFELALYEQSAKNNFKYDDPYMLGTKKEMVHAQTHLRAVQAKYSKKLGSSFTSDFIYFYQESNRDIPPTVSESFSTAYKEETAHRLIFNSRLEKEKFNLNTISSFNSDRLIFADSLKDIYADHLSNTYTFNQDLELLFNPSNRLRLSQNFQHQLIKSEYINAVKPYENRYSLGFNYRKELTTHSAILASAKQELVADKWSPFTPSIGYVYTGNKSSFDFSLNRSFRRPSWNDRYWIPGGNPNLLPEDGMMLNISLAHLIEKKALLTKLKLNMYYGRISDWIIWLPENFYWTPKNLALVEQKGLEFESDMQFPIGKGQFSYTTRASLQCSTNLSERTPGDSALGKQLIYVPLVQLNKTIEWSYNSWQLSANYHFESQRFTTEDHSSKLNAYAITSLNIDKTYTCKYGDFDFGFQVKNIFNKSYQLVLGRPMPGRIYNLNFNYYL